MPQILELSMYFNNLNISKDNCTLKSSHQYLYNELNTLIKAQNILSTGFITTKIITRISDKKNLSITFIS